MTHGDYAFVELAAGGVALRNTVVRVQDVQSRVNGHPDCYATVRRFDDAFRRYVEETGSVRDWAGPSWADYVVFDIDREGELEVALRDTIALCYKLIEIYGVRPDQIRIFFSGRKGFHVLVATELFGPLVPSAELPALLKDIAIAIATEAGVEIDESIYDRTRLFRLPNTEHGKSGFFKIELSWDELTHLDVGAVRELAAGPREFNWTPDNLEPVPGLESILERVAERESQQEPTPRRAPAVEGQIPEGKRNVTLASLGGTMRRRGMEEPEILAALLEINHRRCATQLPEEEVQAIAASIVRYDPVESQDPATPSFLPTSGPDAPPPSADEFLTLTDTGNSTRLVTLHGTRLRYVAKWGKWLVESGGFWTVDDKDVLVRELAKDVGHRLKVEAASEPDESRAKALFNFGLRTLNARGISDMVNLARGRPGIPIDHEALDADGWLLGVENGVVDLRTGQLRAAKPEDLVTLRCPVVWDEGATCPRWERGMQEWFPDPEPRSYVHRGAGSALVGAQRDHVFVIHYGHGRNGKGTFTRAIMRVLGPYATVIHLSLLVEQKYSHHDTIKADLFRTRLAVASETARRVRLDEASVKNLTGADRITARRMREDPWEYDPTHSLWLQTNHLPEIGGRDTGIWSRIRVVKWESTFEGKDQDQDLDATLAAEAPGILRWLVEGCLEWQEHGLSEPEAVIRETLAYRNAEDTFARFQTDMGLVFRPGLEMQAGTLQEMVSEWAAAEGIDPPQGVGSWLKENGAARRQRRIKDRDGIDRRRWFWIGIGVENDRNSQSEQTDVLG